VFILASTTRRVGVRFSSRKASAISPRRAVETHFRSSCRHSSSFDRDALLMHAVALHPIVPALAENPRAVMSVAGDWTFIPGAWKAIGDEDPRRGIPTTGRSWESASRREVAP
jgi:hypothetical protein